MNSTFIAFMAFYGLMLFAVLQVDSIFGSRDLAGLIYALTRAVASGIGALVVLVHWAASRA